VGDARGEQGEEQLRPPCPCPCPPAAPKKKILMVIKCQTSFLQDNTDIYDFFAFSNINKQANLQLPLHVQKLKVALPPDFPTRVSAPKPRYILLMLTTTEIKVDIWPTTKKLLPLCSGPYPCCPLSFRIL